jgi:hypothetical protein
MDRQEQIDLFMLSKNGQAVFRRMRVTTSDLSAGMPAKEAVIATRESNVDTGF